jgi:predicted lipoprotein with Yx(FWY)xxD motif
MTRPLKIASILFAAALVLAACGDDDDDAAVTGTAAPTTSTASGSGGSGGSDGATTTTAGAAASATTAAPAAAATITVATTSLGDVLADADGRTLYVFAKDAQDTSNCTGGCLQLWPRYAPATVTAGDGVDASALGSFGVDGVQQATVAGQPLYYYASDTGPGDVNGQGVGDNWWVVAPDGTRIEQ